jgi:hypothetical protein
MNNKLQKIRIPMNGEFFIAFILLLFLLTQMHQLIHHIVGEILCGKTGFLTFDRHFFSPTLTGKSYKLATIAGPLFSHYMFMWIGLFMLRSGKYSLAGFSLIFASMPLGRFWALTGGDERFYGLWISQLTGLSENFSMILSIIIVLLILVPPLIAAYKSISNSRRWIVFLAFLILPLFFYGLFIFYPDHRFLYSSVLKAYETGISTNPMTTMFWGLPIILILAIVACAMLFFRKYIKYLVPNRKQIRDNVYSGPIDSPIQMNWH